MPEETEDTRPVRNRTDRFLLIVGDEEILFDPGKLLVSEVVAIEKAAQLVWAQVIGGLNMGNGSALQAAVWIMRKRSNPKLKLSEVEFAWGDLTNLDPDYRTEYGGIPRGEAFGDEEVADDNQPEDRPQDEAPKEDPVPEG